jgi:hypothetical protein
MAAFLILLIVMYALLESRRLPAKQELWRRAEEIFHALLDRLTDIVYPTLRRIARRNLERRRARKRMKIGIRA